MQFLMKPTEMF